MAKYTKAQVDTMTSEQYKENFNNDPEFRAYIDGEYNSAPNTATRPAGSVRPADVQTPAQTFANDPSWADEEQPAPVSAAAQPAAQPAPVAELPEKIHEYQPVDRNGRPVGGKQVFKYRTQDELIEKLTKAHSASSARIRELSRSRKLDEITDAGVTATKVPRPTDAVPATPEELAKELRSVRESNYALAIRVAVNTFLENCPEYAQRYRSQENNESLILAVGRAADDETDPDSYMRAFAKLRDVMDPVMPATAPAAAVPAPTPAPVEQPKRAGPAIRPANANRIGTGLSSADSFNPEVEAAPTKVAGVRLVMPNGQTKVMTLADWNKQSSEFQKRVLRNGSNAAQINALYDAEDQKRTAARSGR
jgi:hypothetical protein